MYLSVSSSMVVTKDITERILKNIFQSGVYFNSLVVMRKDKDGAVCNKHRMSLLKSSYITMFFFSVKRRAGALCYSHNEAQMQAHER